MSMISIDFTKAIAQAKRLDTLAARISKLASQQYEETLEKLANEWQSESASEFITKAEKLKNEMLATSVSIKKTADNVRITATRIYNAEKRAEEIARARTAKI